MDATPDDWLEQYRSYLHLLARLEIGNAGGGRVEASDIVQQTLLEAHQQLDQLRGQSDAERAAWLRRILANNLADGFRAQRRECRDFRRERSLNDSSARLASLLAAPQPSPSAHAAGGEEALRLAHALEQLPEAQREALILQHWRSLTLAQIGERLDKTPVAVAGLLKRGLARLRELLQE